MMLPIAEQLSADWDHLNSQTQFSGESKLLALEEAMSRPPNAVERDLLAFEPRCLVWYVLLAPRPYKFS